METIKITCGAFLFDKSGRMLIGHPTNHRRNVWSIPKGRPEIGESVLETIVRELEEETGIKLAEHVTTKIEYLGEFTYSNQKKKLVAYQININSEIPLEELHCDSMVAKEIYGVEVPEFDNFMWATKQEAKKLIASTQKIALNLTL